MVVRTSIAVFGGKCTYKLIVEPWADEYLIQPCDRCSIVVIHPTSVSPFGVELHDDTLIVWVEIGDATYEFCRGETVEFVMPVPMPGPLGELDRYVSEQQRH